MLMYLIFTEPPCKSEAATGGGGGEGDVRAGQRGTVRRRGSGHRRGYGSHDHLDVFVVKKLMDGDKNDVLWHF